MNDDLEEEGKKKNGTENWNLFKLRNVGKLPKGSCLRFFSL